MLGHLRERDRRKPENRIGPCRTWQLVADGAPMDTGERNQIFRSFSGTEAQARVALRKLLHELDTNSVSHDENVRLSVWIDRWLAHKVAQKRRRRTIDSYTDLLRLHVTPAVGTQRLSDLTTIKLQRLFDDIHAKGRLTRTRLGEGLSANTVRRVHQALAAALDFAVKMGLLIVSRGVVYE
jgi:hypothetical protein